MLLLMLSNVPSFAISYNVCFLTDCSSKDILMRVVAQNLSPELTLVEKVYDKPFNV